jgi:eukaryotic-like serine/threonine-protein kinase
MTDVEQSYGEPKPGDVLAGKYRVERVLGVGGMGVVVAAHHLQLDERVALKFLLPQAVRSATSVARFLQEARAAVKVKSEHVARVTDVGQLENGAPYMVMEYLEGNDLGAWLEKRGVMPVEQAVDFVLQACEALADAHSLGIVHRDLKPANLFCIQRSDGQLSIKVLDFGISKITTAGEAGHGMTKTSMLMGSPLYMSPEQMKLTKGVDARADIWSLGVILFELVTGHPPFNAEAVTELAIKVAMEPPPPLRQFRPDAPQGLEQVIAKCLEKDRAKRFQNVAELAIALKDFGTKSARISVDRVIGTMRNAGISGGDVPASTDFKEESVGAAVGAAVTQGSTPQTAASWGQTGAGTTSAGGKAALGIGVALVLSVLALAAVLFMRKPATPAAAGPAVSVPVAASDPPAAVPSTVRAEPSSPPAVVQPTVVPTPPPAVPPAVATPIVRPVTQPTHPGAVGGSGVPQPALHPSASPATQSPPPAAKPNCNPNWYVDSAGIKKYKPECI